MTCYSGCDDGVDLHLCFQCGGVSMSLMHFVLNMSQLYM